MSFKYWVRGFNNGATILEFEDGAQLEMVVPEGITPAELDVFVHAVAPKPPAPPAFLAEGEARTARTSAEQKYFDGVNSLQNMDPGELARTERNTRLTETDFYGLSDQTMPPAIAAYRQALRDLPGTSGWNPSLIWDDMKGPVVVGVAWPPKPAV